MLALAVNQSLQFDSGNAAIERAKEDEKRRVRN
jgi:hypothetical protein